MKLSLRKLIFPLALFLSCIGALPSPVVAASKAPETFSEEAWRHIAPLYEKIRHHPFNEELAKGTLPPEKFRYYGAQDAQYLEDFARSLALLSAKLDQPKEMDLALKFARESLEEGKNNAKDTWHEKKPALPSPTTMLYTNYELSIAAYKSPEELAAVLLPCFWIYAELGKELSKQAVFPNPYQNWLKAYKNPDYRKSADQMIALTNRLAEKASPQTRQKMMEAFVMASRMELRFWDAAYHLEGWE